MFLKEDRFYSWPQLLILSGLVTILITGIFIISCKPEKNKDAKNEKPNSNENSPRTGTNSAVSSARKNQDDKDDIYG